MKGADMQKYFEKIKEQIAENGCELVEATVTDTILPVRVAMDIANQVAEEFATDTNVGNKDDCCEWVRDNYEFDVYDTECKNRHVFFEGSPSDNEYEFCPYCGKKIKVV